MIPHKLDSLTFPLRGAQLIEASAGTGKTWTIAALYVRLVLGHGDTIGAENGLAPPNILVATFTKAAAQELRDRIRTRLNETARFFRETFTGKPDDFLESIRGAYPSPDAWPRCARRLEIAGECMDQATVSTIHSWCQTMLRQHAFDSGSLFTLELDTDTALIFSEIVRDYWRTYLRNGPVEIIKEIQKIWSTPENLETTIKGLKPNLALIPASDIDAANDFETQFNTKWAKCDALKKSWIEEGWIEKLQNALDDANDKKLVDGRSINKVKTQGWCDILIAWINQQEQFQPEFGDRGKAAWRNLSHDGFEAILNKKGTTPPNFDWRPFDAFDTMVAELDAAAKAALDGALVHATVWTVHRFDEQLRKDARVGFDELLSRFDEALETKVAWASKSPEARRLIERIRVDFPVALIDEFQDTDPVQYRIFRSIYLDHLPGNTAGKETTALVMIGDPKQAIYAFRDADIYTYLDARRACKDNLHTLDTNFRSATSAVDAVNALFNLGETSERGAFLFKKGDDNPVPFYPVTPNGLSESLLALPGCNPDLGRALTLHHLIRAANQSEGKDSEKMFNKDHFTATSAMLCADRIVELLNAGASHPPTLGFSKDGETLTRGVQPSDIAILVNKGKEAEAIRNALHKRNVRSVYLSEKEEVYEANEAKDLRFILQACGTPNNLRALKTALATPLITISLAELDEINRDENLMETYQNQFIEYQRLWRKRGVLPMIRRVLHDFDVPARLLNTLGELNGERTLTNTLHIAELLQQASNLLEGEPALIRYLSEQIEGEGAEPNQDSRKLRLESDEQLVKVVTIHASKGLEYPLVFVPFTCSTWVIDSKEKHPLRYHLEDGTPCIEFDNKNEENVARADNERLGEDMRKLYVALTRARYSTWVGLGEMTELTKSAIGNLLWGSEVATADTRQLPEYPSSVDPAHLLRIHIDPSMADSPKPPVQFISHQPEDGEQPLFWRKPTRDLHENWWVASYTAIAKYDLPDSAQTTALSNDAQISAAPISAEEAEFDEDHRIATQESAQQSAQQTAQTDASKRSSTEQTTGANETPHLFPGGTGVGNFLHGLFEQLAHRGFDEVASDPSVIDTLVNKACAGTEWEEFIPGLIDWFTALVTTPLINDVALGNLTRVKTKAEMEFWVAANHVDLAKLDATIRKQTLSNAHRPIINSGMMNGMLKGFIDLLFEHEGRYYVLDYKSNRVGPEGEDYTTERMREVILKSRYDLQYVLYLFALHRLLKSRLPNYDYDTHVGGAIYFFLRGIFNPSHGVHFEKPPKSLMDDLDALFSASNQRGCHESI